MKPSGAVDASAPGRPWYRSLDRRQWRTLGAANLGWLFDGYEAYALILTVTSAFRELLPPDSYQFIPFYSGIAIAVTLLGWGIGGIAGGIAADYVGRKRMLIYSVLAYSFLTGLTAFAWSWISFIVLRFIVGVALGSEWGTGASMMAEMWPREHRGKGAGLMQCGLGIGFFVASAIWFLVSPLGPSAWRWMFVIGVLPALATLWIRRGVDEPPKWVEADRQRRAAPHRARFPLATLFANPRSRGLTIVAFLMATATTLGWWGISSWVPPYVASAAAAQGLAPARWTGLAGMAYNAGGVIGYLLLGFCADAWGRKPVVLAWYAGSLLMTPVLFFGTDSLPLLLLFCAINAVFTLGQFTWCSAWLPEAFPTSIRATAIGFCFNAPRFVAFLGPLVAGTLITAFGEYGRPALLVSLVYVVGVAATPFFPETRGAPLPD
ncbi:MAG TPA: MFS transporter [Vicinamibacterales bacterium]